MDWKEFAFNATSWLALLVIGIGIGTVFVANSTLPPEEIKKRGEQEVIGGLVVLVATNAVKGLSEL